VVAPRQTLDSLVRPPAASPGEAVSDESVLLARTLWSVPEAASFLRVSKRSLWRMLADPRSGFPPPRRIRGRTLLVRDEVIAFMQEGGAT